jgi:hypothetical protein
MVWGCIIAKGVGKILRVSHKINSKDYCDVLYNGFIKSCEMHNYNLSEVILMQDGATCHTSKETKKWLSDNNFNVLP